jgi:hypothetical protein
MQARHRQAWVVSSAVEHYLDMVGVTGSIPVPPTIQSFQNWEFRDRARTAREWRAFATNRRRPWSRKQSLLYICTAILAPISGRRNSFPKPDSRIY